MNRMLKGCAVGCGVMALLLIGLAASGFFWYQNTFGGPQPAAPTLAAATALRPLFVLNDGKSYSAGTAVAARLSPDADPVLLTALHLFGPSGGLDENVAPGRLDEVVREVLLVPVGGERPVAHARGAVRKSGPALSDDDPGVGNDVAAFRLLPLAEAGAEVEVLPLAAANPKMGEWVWLVGDVFDHEPQTQRLFAGRVLAAGDNGARVKLVDRFPLRAFSGAPLINSRKEVVGLLIGGNEGLAIINPARNIRKRLTEDGVK